MLDHDRNRPGKEDMMVESVLNWHMLLLLLKKYSPGLVNFTDSKDALGVLFGVYYTFNERTDFRVKKKYILHFLPQSIYNDWLLVCYNSGFTKELKDMSQT